MKIPWADGGMVDALVLGTSEAIRAGSSPVLPTTFVIQKVFFSSHKFDW